MTALLTLLASAALAKPVLVEFTAPWCYSCYYMEKKVLSQPAFLKASEAFERRKMDIDTPEGAAMKAKLAAVFTPTYVLLDKEGGKELGRIVGEQTEEEFHAKLKALLGGGRTSDADSEALLKRIGAGDLAALRKTLADPSDCRLPYYVSKGQGPASKLPAAEARALLQEERAALEKLASSKLFGPAAARCADFRSGVMTLAEVQEKLDDASARDGLLDRAIAQLRKEHPKVGEDRNADDDLRAMLAARGDHEGLRRHFEALIAAYPLDYVYSLRWAKVLLERGKAEEALGWVEKADKLSYGANRLDVTVARAKVLAALGRREEGLALIKRDLGAAKSRFPDRAAAMEKALADLSKDS